MSTDRADAATSARVEGASGDRVGAACRLVIAFRLLALLVTIVYIPLREEDAPVLSLALVAAALASYLPLRYWDRLAPALFRHPSVLSADLLLALFILALAGADSPFFYFTLGIALLGGLVHGRVGAVFFGALLLLGYYLVVLGRIAVLDEPTSFQLLVGLPALYPLCTAAGAAVRRLLDRQAAVEHELDYAARAAATGEERARVAREMHDSLAKTLHGLSLSASAVAVRLRRDPAGAEASARSLAAAAETAAAEARELIRDLRADELDTPLGQALERHVKRWSSTTGIAAEIAANGVELRSPATRYELFAILSEALANVERHARSSGVRVSVGGDGDQLSLAVADDGVGFLAEGELEDLEPEGHFGLIGMAERAQRVGGRLELTSAPGAGTTITATVPREPKSAVGVDLTQAGSGARS